MTRKALGISLLSICVLSLTSCRDTDELYGVNDYITGTFDEVAYRVFADGTSTRKEADITLENINNGYFNGSGTYDAPSDCLGYGQAKGWHPSWFMNGSTELSWTPDIINHGVGVYADQSSLVGVSYSQTKKLSLNYPKFREGYLSRLYDGMIRCNSWSFYSMMLLDGDGFGTTFPYTLSEAEYFALSLRGGSDTPDSGVGRVVTFDLYITFYKQGSSGLEPYTVALNEVKVQSNYSAECTSLVGFTFDDASYDPSGVVGMSLAFDLADDPYAEETSSDFSSEGYHLGLCLLEVLIPDSTWN